MYVPTSNHGALRLTPPCLDMKSVLFDVSSIPLLLARVAVPINLDFTRSIRCVRSAESGEAEIQLLDVDRTSTNRNFKCVLAHWPFGC